MKRLFASVSLTVFLCACTESGLPKPGSQKYSDLCSAFFLGLAGLQAGEDVRAKEFLTRSTQIAPGEPAAWADLGILQVRQQQFDAAFTSVSKAHELLPDNSQLEALLGLVESRRGHLPEAIAHLKKAVSLDPNNVRALYTLAEETERQSGNENAATAQQLLQKVTQQQPHNTAAWLDNLRLAAKRGDAAEVQRSLAAIRPFAAGWPAAAQHQLATLEQTANQGNVRPAAVQAQFLRNVLLRVPEYRAGLDQIKTSANLVAQPFVTFLRLAPPQSQVAAADTSTQFTAQPLSPEANQPAIQWAGAPVVDPKTGPVAAWADDRTLHLSNGAQLPLPGSATTLHLAAADLDYDFKPDLILASAQGVKLYRQIDPQHFSDVTALSKLPASVLAQTYSGVWPFDFDQDGDLDLVLGRQQAAPVVLRNNGDGSFTPVEPFAVADGTRGFLSADLDGDGNPDAVLLDHNHVVHVLLSQRGGKYAAQQLPAGFTQDIGALAAGDIEGAGSLDLVLLKLDGTIVRIAATSKDAAGRFSWQAKTVAHTSASPNASLLLADVDNNGALDLIANRTILLGDGKSFHALPAALAATPRAVADLNGDGKLDLVAWNDGAAPVQLINRGSKNYRWQIVRTQAAQAAGDQRINSLGIGGEIEIRSGLLTQKQIVAAPYVHFGLGDHNEVPFARLVWPNGVIQAEFELKPDQTVLAEQRIKGSCPMLYTWNGREMQFVKDVGPWGSGLGIDVNEDGKGIYAPTEWFKVRGDQLVPKNGIYEIRLTDEYWETYYLDQYSLVAVDHPVDSEIYTDERYVVPAPKPGLIVTSQTTPFARAIDDTGADVTETVRTADNHFLGGFGKGQYQGLTRDHWVELQLPDNAPSTGPLLLVADGWVEETEESLMKAEAQNSHAHEQEISIETQGADGCWRPVHSKLGFPKGRYKTIVLDISRIFAPGVPRKLRLRNNLEIYWDRLAWATTFPADAHVQMQPLRAASADLSYRGFSLVTKADAISPELPHYAILANTGLRWRDQEGYVTRYGDVRELLDKIDDRYVITSPGDELRMTFAAPPPPPAGWTRDFILICDGWVKDGDHNSNFAGTVLPLPYHAMKDYAEAPTTLENEHAYKEHPDDWRTYHTRYVGAHDVVSALWGATSGSRAH